MATAFLNIKSQRFEGQLGREWHEQFRLCRKVRNHEESYLLEDCHQAVGLGNSSPWTRPGNSLQGRTLKLSIAPNPAQWFASGLSLSRCRKTSRKLWVVMPKF